jgi:hypothetical protein
MGWMNDSDVVHVHAVAGGRDVTVGGMMTIHREGSSGQRWLMMNRLSSQHFLHNPPAIAIDAGAFDRNKRTPQNSKGFTHIGVLDQETGWMYGLTLEHFWEKHEAHNAHDREKLMKYGLQYKVALGEWKKIPIRETLREPGAPVVTIQMAQEEQARREKSIADTEAGISARAEVQRLAEEGREKKRLAKAEFQKLKESQGCLF